MEREQISKMAAAMADKQDILDLLNKIKHDEMRLRQDLAISFIRSP